MSPAIYTVGYEGVTNEALVRVLRENGVARVIDLRAVPLSRKKGFSKNVLKDFLAAHGIAYTHLRGLGTPPEGREAVRKNRLAQFREIFAAHMATEAAQTGLHDAVALAQAEAVCLLCFEADPGHCHRTIVAQDMQRLTGQEIVPLRAAL